MCVWGGGGGDFENILRKTLIRARFFFGVDGIGPSYFDRFLLCYLHYTIQNNVLRCVALHKK